MKISIVAVIQNAVDNGVSKTRVCLLMQINVRRIERWEQRQRATGTMNYRKPGPQHAWHALKPSEACDIIEYVQLERTSDMSLQQLAHNGREEGVFCVSASCIRSVILEEGLLVQRVKRRRCVGNGLKPARPDELTGPNECWTWDISYVLTVIKRLYYYLYVMLDEWSRKVVAWHIAYTMQAREAKQLINTAVINENLLEAPDNQRPIIVNDRGKQMKAKAVKNMFIDLHMPQTFSRPRTPNDNPFIESFFGTVKTAQSWPGCFPANGIETVCEYFEKYFNWYNTRHFHSGINYLHPADKHAGLEDQIIKERENQLTNQRNARKMYWLNQQLTGSSL